MRLGPSYAFGSKVSAGSNIKEWKITSTVLINKVMAAMTFNIAKKTCLSFKRKWICVIMLT